MLFIVSLTAVFCKSLFPVAGQWFQRQTGSPERSVPVGPETHLSPPHNSLRHVSFCPDCGKSPPIVGQFNIVL